MVEMVWRGLVLNSTASMRESGIVYDFVTKIPSTVWVFMTSFFRMEKIFINRLFTFTLRKGL
ncbi:hypothetical protein GGQ95_003203 [Anoxybacillus rupiensis]|jgi:hypothetical protein|nr:hypothetical protein [Anoxybacillus rupiensis]